VWSARLRAGIAGSGKPAADGWLLLAQGCGVAEQVLRAAAARSLRIQAALATGASGPSLLRLARLGADLKPEPRLLLALHRPCSFAELLQLGRRRARVVLLVTDSAEPLLQVPAPAGSSVPSTSQLARSLGIPVTRSPEELAAAAALLDAGLRPEKRLVLGVAARPDEALLLADALGRAGLRRGGGAPAGAVLRSGDSRSSRRRADAMVVIPAPGRQPRIVPAGARGEAGVPADGDSLRALTALLDPCPASETAAPRGGQARARRAGLLLDRWPAELSEVEVKLLLAIYGLRAPAELLVSSASAAARAAGQLGFPVAIKAAGPGLRGRAQSGALRLGLPGGAAVRQAFHDVLDACARLRPSPALAGVLISRMVPLPFALEVSLLWPREAGEPPVLIARRRREADEVLGLPCPIGSAQTSWMADRLLRTAPGHDRLADWLRKLSLLAPDLNGRLRWLRLDTVSPPAGSTPPLIIDGEALQTASRRDPLGLRGGAPLDD
jgi:hypothetical protein